MGIDLAIARDQRFLLAWPSDCRNTKGNRMYGRTKELQERRGAVQKKLVELFDRTEKENRGFNEDERSQWDALTSEAADLDQRIKVSEQIETGASRYSEEDLEQHDRQLFEDRRRATEPERRPLTRLEQHRAFHAWAHPRGASDEDLLLARRAGYRGNELNLQFRRDGAGVPRSIEDIDRLYRSDPEQRAQSLTAASGGYTVQDELMRAIEVSMLTFGNVRREATVITTATGADLPIPTVNDTGNVGAILAENTQASAQDMTFAQIVLQAFKYSSKLVLVSAELMQDSTINLAAFLGERLGERIARIQNQHYTTGDASSKPNGIVTAAGNSSVTAASATALTWSEMMSLKHSVDPAYRVGGKWMMDDVILGYLKKQLDSQNRPLWVPNLATGAPDRYDGDEIVVNNDMATGTSSKAVIYGALSKYFVREVEGMTLLRLDERYADYHQVGFLAFARSDGDLIDAGTDPVKYLTMAAT